MNAQTPPLPAEGNDHAEAQEAPELVRQHRLPSTLYLTCLLCGAETTYPLEGLHEREETPCCSSCQNPLDPRLERDVRTIAFALDSIRHFLPEGRLLAPPREEKAWAVGLG